MHQHDFHQIPGSLRDFPQVGVMRCLHCGLVTHAEDTSGAVSYESGTMHSWSKNWGDRNPPKEDFARRLKAVSTILSHSQALTYLDYGCGSGDLVRAIRSEGGEAFGLEPELSFVHPSLVESGYVVKNAEELSKKQFGVISLFHVIEHVYDPLPFLEHLRTLLSETGSLVIETPNADDALANDYGCEEFRRFTYWSHHPFLYSSKALTELLMDAGYEILISTQVQRYGLANHIHWLGRGERGGHERWGHLFSQQTDESYGSDLVREGTADTIWIVAKPF